VLYLKNRINTEENNEMTQLEQLEQVWMDEVENYREVCRMIDSRIITGEIATIKFNLASEIMGNAFCAYSIARVRANKDGE
jgi:hypothetical protein